MRAAWAQRARSGCTACALCTLCTHACVHLLDLLHPTCTSPAPRMHPSQLAHDEGAAAGEVHAIVAEGRGGEEAIKSGADLLARAQALHD